MVGHALQGFASFGGYVAGRADIIDLLRYGASGFLFSAGLPPGDAAAARAAMRRMRATPELSARARANAARFGALGVRPGSTPATGTTRHLSCPA
ncbi:hypothetical protein [Lentzea jiangxiensis]|uniref:hypothetical protein n=1 Tax=Lentzea jiangxiensis TaxID=641025 RepID=UPI000AF297CD|nr:hypothetical protein [Lentzea jiangxiensis]